MGLKGCWEGIREVGNKRGQMKIRGSRRIVSLWDGDAMIERLNSCDNNNNNTEATRS